MANLKSSIGGRVIVNGVEVCAMESTKGGGTRLHLKSGQSIEVKESVDEAEVVLRQAGLEEAHQNSDY